MSNTETPHTTSTQDQAKETDPKVDEDGDSGFVGFDEFEGPEPDIDPFEDTVDPFTDTTPKEQEAVALHKPKGESRTLHRHRRCVLACELIQF